MVSFGRCGNQGSVSVSYVGQWTVLLAGVVGFSPFVHGVDSALVGQRSSGGGGSIALASASEEDDDGSRLNPRDFERQVERCHDELHKRDGLMDFVFGAEMSVPKCLAERYGDREAEDFSREYCERFPEAFADKRHPGQSCTDWVETEAQNLEMVGPGVRSATRLAPRAAQLPRDVRLIGGSVPLLTAQARRLGSGTQIVSNAGEWSRIVRGAGGVAAAAAVVSGLGVLGSLFARDDDGHEEESRPRVPRVVGGKGVRFDEMSPLDTESVRIVLPGQQIFDIGIDPYRARTLRDLRNGGGLVGRAISKAPSEGPLRALNSAATEGGGGGAAASGAGSTSKKGTTKERRYEYPRKSPVTAFLESLGEDAQAAWRALIQDLNGEQRKVFFLSEFERFSFLDGHALASQYARAALHGSSLRIPLSDYAEIAKAINEGRPAERTQRASVMRPTREIYEAVEPILKLMVEILEARAKAYDASVLDPHLVEGIHEDFGERRKSGLIRHRLAHQLMSALDRDPSVFSRMHPEDLAAIIIEIVEGEKKLSVLGVAEISDAVDLSSHKMVGVKTSAAKLVVTPSAIDGGYDPIVPVMAFDQREEKLPLEFFENLFEIDADFAVMSLATTLFDLDLEHILDRHLDRAYGKEVVAKLRESSEAERQSDAVRSVLMLAQEVGITREDPELESSRRLIRLALDKDTQRVDGAIRLINEAISDLEEP